MVAVHHRRGPDHAPIRFADRVDGPAAAGAGQVDDALVRRRLGSEAVLTRELDGPSLRAGRRVVSREQALEVDREDAPAVVSGSREVVNTAELDRAPVDGARCEVEGVEAAAVRAGISDRDVGAAALDQGIRDRPAEIAAPDQAQRGAQSVCGLAARVRLVDLVGRGLITAGQGGDGGEDEQSGDDSSRPDQANDPRACRPPGRPVRRFTTPQSRPIV